MNIVDRFAEAVKKNPDKIAVYWGNLCVPYKTIWQRSLSLARIIKNDFKAKKGDRVGLLCKNRPEFIPALFGILSAECVVVPINNFLKSPEISYILNDAGIDILITETSFSETTHQLKNERPNLNIWYVDDLESIEQVETPLRCNSSENDLAVIIYTSGTTGRPKGAMLTHKNLICNVNSTYAALDLTEEDRLTLVLPMFHSFMLTVGILLPLFYSCSIVLIKSLHPIKNITDDLIKWRATLLPAMPQVYRAFLHPSIPSDLPLRLCISGSAPLPIEVLEQFNRKFKFPLLEGYGLSEASPVCSVNPIRGIARAGSIGVPIPGVEMSVQDDEGNFLSHGVVGEICVRGGNVMLGYWNQPEETQKVFRNGWLLTGDVGYYDKDGYFFITDRKKDMMIVNGNNVYSREIEEVIMRFPGVKEAAVVGKPDPRRGEQPVAYITLNDGATVVTESIIKFCRDNLADYKVPRRVIILSEMPRNATGKILKTQLRMRNDW